MVGSSIKEISYIQYKDSNKAWTTFFKNSYILEERQESTGGRYRVKENYKYSYNKDNLGKSIGLETRLGLRNFLVFPREDIKVGESWINDASYNVNLFGKNIPYITINFDIIYRLESILDTTDDKICNISANTLFTRDKNRDVFMKHNILKYLGYSSYFIKFSVNQGRILSVNETFDYAFLLIDGTLVENSGIANFTYELPPPPSKEEIERLQNITHKKIDIEDININENNDNTVTISIENIKFKPDSAILTNEELIRIDKIANLLANYRSNNLVIIGHTANVGNKSVQKRLSEERAKGVLDYLVKKHGFLSSNLSYEGRGGEYPIADNSTEDGKAKNRRVEIVILKR